VKPKPASLNKSPILRFNFFPKTASAVKKILFSSKPEASTSSLIFDS